jgi:glycosyltransferase involved in cell wall biosynthesis
MLINVSIITPVYNVERCIEKTIKSIINQSSKNFELLLIDDGSKDKSIEIANRLLENSNVNYKIITQKNSGVSAARNRGIEAACGEYIAFLDSDDYIDSRFVELMYNKAKETQCDVIFCDYSEVDIDGNVLVKNRVKYLNDSIDRKEAALKQLNDEINIGMRSAIYKTSIIKDNKLLFDSNRKYGEDMIFIVKTLLHSNKITSVNEVLAFYVIWGSSVTNSVSLKHLDCYYSYLDLLEYVKKDRDLKEIESFLIEYKIPYAIAHVFSVLSRDKNFHEDLFKFLDKKDVKGYLRAYKIQKFNKNHIRYLIQCKGILYCPNILLKIFSNRV